MGCSRSCACLFVLLSFLGGLLFFPFRVFPFWRAWAFPYAVASGGKSFERILLLLSKCLGRADFLFPVFDIFHLYEMLSPEALVS